LNELKGFVKMTLSANPAETQPPVYQGQFGEFTIDAHDRREVLIYRGGLVVAAITFAIATAIAWTQTNPSAGSWNLISGLYSLFCLALGVSLLTIHIYMKALHRVLQGFWAIGVVASIAIAHADAAPFAITVYQHPVTLLGVGFVFAALTGIYFKEAFCFDRLETKVLTPLVPVLLLGHLCGLIPFAVERFMLVGWAIFFLVFASRKAVQPIPPDIGDKSVFVYLQEQERRSN
jgi:uncharacterized integral membrane protein